MKYYLLSFACMLLISCAAFRGGEPQGFAVYDDVPGNELRAISPEGITWRIHEEEHDPQADLTYWKQAMRKRMSEAGYRVVDSVAFTAKGLPGWALELTAPLGQSDYYYLVAVVPKKKELVVVEASGNSSDWGKRRASLFAKLSELPL